MRGVAKSPEAQEREPRMGQNRCTVAMGLRRVCHEGRRPDMGWLPCFTKDEGRPLGTALQEEVSNHRKRLGAKALVVSVTGKGEA